MRPLAACLAPAACLVTACSDAVQVVQRHRAAEMASVTWQAGRYVAAGQRAWFDVADTVAQFSESTWLLTSTDGIAWAAALEPVRGQLRAVTAGDSSLVALGSFDGSPNEAGEGLVFVRDGAGEWRPGGSLSLKWRSVAHGPSAGFVGVGELPNLPESVVASSVDGASWTVRATTDIPQPNLLSADRRYVLWGNAATIFMSGDAGSWSRQTIDSVTELTALAHVDGRFLGSGVFDRWSGREPDSVRYYDVASTDGETWTVRRRMAPRDRLTRMASGAGRVVALSRAAVFASEDGLSWTRVFESNHALRDIVFADGRFVIVGRTILTSNDGLSWRERLLPR